MTREGSNPQIKDATQIPARINTNRTPPGNTVTEVIKPKTRSGQVAGAQ
jgi:hypothetical protein